MRLSFRTWEKYDSAHTWVAMTAGGNCEGMGTYPSVGDGSGSWAKISGILWKFLL